MGVFFVETLARAALHEEGLLGYFSNLENMLDLIVLLFCGTLEILDYLKYFDLVGASTLVASVRLMSSLRTINMLYHSAIDTEDLINRSLESTVEDLQEKCNSLAYSGMRLCEELQEKRHLISQIKLDLSALENNMISVQRKSWDSLVPSGFVLDIANKRSKTRSKRAETIKLSRRKKRSLRTDSYLSTKSNLI